MPKQISLVNNNWELREAERLARLNLYDNGDQGLFTDIDVVKTPKGNPIIAISKRLERVNSNDTAVTDYMCRAVSADDAKAVYDIGVCGKVEDVVFPFKKKIERYGPLSDIDSKNMQFFVTSQAGEIMSDSGVDIDIMDEELQEIESVPVTDEQDDLAKATYAHRSEIESIRRQLAVQRSRIEIYHPDWAGLNHDEFVQKVMKEGSGEDCRHYLNLEARLLKNKKFIDKYSSSIMYVTLPKIYIPEHIGNEDIRLPSFNVATNRFMPEKLTISDVDELANQKVEDIEALTLDAIPEIKVSI